MTRRLLSSVIAAAATTTAILITSCSAPSSVTPTTPPPAEGSRVGGGEVTPNAQLPEPIRVDENAFKIVNVLRGVGKQIYDCDTAQGKFVLREPVADLFTAGSVPAGIHGAGPFWADFDGSRVVGQPGPVSAPSPNGPSNIAWLKVTAASAAGVDGVLSKVAFVQRVDTRGGVAPASCTASATTAVDYTTNYVFWAPT